MFNIWNIHVNNSKKINGETGIFCGIVISRLKEIMEMNHL